MKIYIDTRDRNNIRISILKNGKPLASKEVNTVITPESALSLLAKVLEENEILVSDLKEIIVERGPGSYTGTRVGVSIANALSLALKIPVNSKEISDLEIPEY